MYIFAVRRFGNVHEVAFFQKNGRDSSFKEPGVTMYNKAIRNKQLEKGEAI